ncbi:MAG: DEAD/DEAH box helicase [Deltaproteobacteria bacterium]|nr:DEAD/DEAH box helicase [Deltaproteobacteria bacterium]
MLANIGVPLAAPFHADPFQEEALEAIREQDVIVTAPTGAGKTWIAVEAIRRELERGGRAWYTSPLKALSNSKYVELKRSFGEDTVGIVTGDRQENLSAPVLVATAEIYRNRLYDFLRGECDIDHGLVVFDEAHYVADLDRGVTWEEAWIFSPPSVRCLLLSATIANADQLATWMAGVRGTSVRIVATRHRPVPMETLFVYPDGWRLGPFWESGRRVHHDVREAANQGRGASTGPRGPRRFRRSVLPRDLISLLRRHDLLPALVFMGSRAACDEAAEAFARQGRRIEERRERRIQEVLDQIVADVPALAGHRHMESVLRAGAAAHHAGHHPAWKLALETLMAEGLLDALFSTTTMAAGVDFPTRSACITRSVLWDGRDERPFLARELQQMTGRAGRRGKDRVGFAVVVPGPAMDVDEIAHALRSQPEPIESQFKASYTMALNLLGAFDPKQVRELLDKSFAQYQRAITVRDLRAEADALERRVPTSGETRGVLRRRRKHLTDLRIQADHLEEGLWREFERYVAVLRHFGYVGVDDRPTPEGLWAALLRLDHPLLLAEGIRNGAIVPDRSIVAVAGALAGGDREFKRNPELPAEVGQAIVRLVTIAQHIEHIERQLGVAERPMVNVSAAWAMDRIVTGEGWPQVDCDEGDLVRLAWRTVDVLRQLGNLVDTHPQLAFEARHWMHRLQEDPTLVFE